MTRFTAVLVTTFVAFLVRCDRGLVPHRAVSHNRRPGSALGAKGGIRPTARYWAVSLSGLGLHIY